GEKSLAENIEFNVVPLNQNFTTSEAREELVVFQQKANDLAKTINGTESYLKELISKIDKIKQAILVGPETAIQLLNEAEEIEKELDNIYLNFNRESNFPSTEENPPSQVTINERLSVLNYTHYRSTEPITAKEQTTYNVLK
ncbi:MAG: hypothetical protein KDC52_06765, partial [Ignavibacteriae bacterium]|nr:hypothetical protein [Ignavibacteriota bacterium]